MPFHGSHNFGWENGSLASLKEHQEAAVQGHLVELILLSKAELGQHLN